MMMTPVAVPCVLIRHACPKLTCMQIAMSHNNGPETDAEPMAVGAYRKKVCIAANAQLDNI